MTEAEAQQPAQEAAAGRARRRVRTALLFAVLTAAIVDGCAPAAATPEPTGGGPDASAGTAAAIVRVDAIGVAVERWRSAGDLESARRAAEEARNLVAGPFGPMYGDADGDGTVRGANQIGLLPGLEGQPGLATPGLGSCVVADVLGGDWSDPGARWDILLAAIDEWTPSNNTFPTLPSHPQRLFGWATLTLATTDLSAAVEYGGHAQLHLDVSRRAIAGCPA